MKNKTITFLALSTLSFFTARSMDKLHNTPPDYFTESLNPSAEHTMRDQLLKDLQYPFKNQFLCDMQDAIRDLDCDRVQVYMNDVAVLTAKQMRILHTLLNYKDESLSLKALLSLERNNTTEYMNTFAHSYDRFYSIKKKIQFKQPDIEENPGV